MKKGDIVAYSEHGKATFKPRKPDRRGVIAHKPNSHSEEDGIVSVRWDGMRSADYLHRNFLVVVEEIKPNG